MLRGFALGLAVGLMATGVSVWAFQESPSQALERMQQRQERVEQESFRSQQWLENQARRNGPC